MTPRAVNPLVAPVGAGIVGAGVAALFALMPAAMLEDWVWASGLPALVDAAAPPLGMTARAVLALGGGMLAAAVTWSVLYLLFGPGGLIAPKTIANVVPVIRRADAHRDAPPRRPMTAADLGTPLMEVPAKPPAVQAVPADLNQPLSAFDPGAIPDVPLPPPAKVEPLARVVPVARLVPAARPPLAPGERIDTFALTRPPTTTMAEPRRAPAPVQPSIDALLRRLEEVAAQRQTASAR